MSAAQVVDSAHLAAGVALETEAITFDPEGSQTIQNFLNLGPATKAWQLTSLSMNVIGLVLICPKQLQWWSAWKRSDGVLLGKLSSVTAKRNPTSCSLVSSRMVTHRLGHTDD